MSDFKDASVAKHPIGVVSTRSGLPQDVLRAWERRYGAVQPQRTKTGRRLYSDVDVQRLILLKRVVAAGRRISDVATLPLDELQALADADNLSAVEERKERATGDVGEAHTHYSAALDAALRFDPVALERALTEASIALTAPVLRERVIVPLMHEIGKRWRDGKVRVVQEHLASAIVRGFLDGMRLRNDTRRGPKVVVTSLEGQLHEIGALMAAAAAEEIGWTAFYLGPNLPAEEIAAGTREVGAGVIALSLVYSNEERHVRAELANLRRLVGRDVAIIVGGWAAEQYEAAIAEIDGVLAKDFAAFQKELERVGR